MQPCLTYGKMGNMTLGESPPSNPPARRRNISSLVVGILVLLVLVGENWFNTEQRQGLKLQLAERLAMQDTTLKHNDDFLTHLQSNLENLDVRLNALENRTAQSQNQQIELEAMYQELSHNREGWLLAESEHLMVIANQDLTLTGNIPAALTALESAQQQLGRVENPILSPVLRTLQQEIDRLRSLPNVDLVSLANHLDELARDSKQLPLLSEATPLPPVKSTHNNNTDFWPHLQAILKSKLERIVQFQRIDAGSTPLITPEQGVYLQQNLALKFQSARINLLSRNQEAYANDLNAIIDWISHYYDMTNPKTKTLIKQLTDLSNTLILWTPTNIDPALSALHEARQNLAGGTH